MSCNYCWPGNCCGGPNCQWIDVFTEAERQAAYKAAVEATIASIDRTVPIEHRPAMKRELERNPREMHDVIDAALAAIEKTRAPAGH